MKCVIDGVITEMPNISGLIEVEVKENAMHINTFSCNLISWLYTKDSNEVMPLSSMNRSFPIPIDQHGMVRGLPSKAEIDMIRNWVIAYLDTRDKEKARLKCPFCNVDPDTILFRNEFAFAMLDKYPVSEGHILIVPFRHVENYFKLNGDEQRDIFAAVDACEVYLSERYPKCKGINVGINIGKVAGQTIMHTHIHVIPRYTGDVKNPRGGVRGVIPEKRDY